MDEESVSNVPLVFVSLSQAPSAKVKSQTSNFPKKALFTQQTPIFGLFALSRKGLLRTYFNIACYTLFALALRQLPLFTLCSICLFFVELLQPLPSHSCRVSMLSLDEIRDYMRRCLATSRTLLLWAIAMCGIYKSHPFFANMTNSF